MTDTVSKAAVLDGKAAAARLKDALRAEVNELKSKGIVPGLAVIIVGNDPASRVYVNNKKKDCADCGIRSEEYALPETVSQEELIALIRSLNNRSDIHGILCQLPIPKHLNEKEVLEAVSPRKDVDAFHPANVGRIMIGDYRFLPCTPAGVMELLRQNGIDPAGKHCVVVGRSNIVGKPQAMLLLHADATVTICHSKTRNLAEVCRAADILVVAVGRPKLITGDMIKEGAVVIDVGMNRLPDGTLCGDVDYDAAAAKAAAVTPVPGGVGPMTRAMLLQNTVTAAKLQNNLL